MNRLDLEFAVLAQAERLARLRLEADLARLVRAKRLGVGWGFWVPCLSAATPKTI